MCSRTTCSHLVRFSVFNFVETFFSLFPSTRLIGRTLFTPTKMIETKEDQKREQKTTSFDAVDMNKCLEKKNDWRRQRCRWLNFRGTFTAWNANRTAADTYDSEKTSKRIAHKHKMKSKPRRVTVSGNLLQLYGIVRAPTTDEWMHRQKTVVYAQIRLRDRPPTIPFIFVQRLKTRPDK